MSCSPLDKQRGHAYRMGTARTGSGKCHVDAFQFKYGRKVHRDGRIHRAENRSRTDKGGILFLQYALMAAYHRFGARIVAIDDAGRSSFYQIGRNPGIRQGFLCRHVRIFTFFGKKFPRLAVQKAFERRPRDYSRQRGTVTVISPRRVNAYAATSGLEGLRNLIAIRADT